MSSKKKKNNSGTTTNTSMVARLVALWQRKRFSTMVGKHLAIFFFMVLSILIISEQDLAALMRQGVPEQLDDLPSGYLVESAMNTPPGFNFVWLRERFELSEEQNELVEGFDLKVRRLFSWPAREREFFGALKNLRYTYCFETPEGVILLHKELGTTAVVLGSVWLVIFIRDMIFWLLGFVGETRQIRLVLQPLTGRPMEHRPPVTRHDQVPSIPAPEAQMASSTLQTAFAPAIPSHVSQTLTAVEMTSVPIGEKKLGDLAEVIEHVHVGKLDTRIDVASCPRELKPLASAINSMLERIDEAYRLQSQFVSDASHELRTPIAVVQGYAALLDRWGKDDPQALQESIGAIKSEAEHMKLLVEQLLFLARGESSKMQMHPVELDAGALLEEVHREMQLIDSVHIWELRVMEPLLVQADPILLKQALRVLTDNAIKYTPAGESILLKAEVKDELVKLSVQDNGVGIAADDLPRIFDRFYRADSSRDKKTGGTGLGLAIAKWIVEKHQGYFELLSRPEIGTRVTICLPLLKQRSV